MQTAECYCLKPVSPQCYHREPPNQVSHLEGGTGDRKLVRDRPFAPHQQFADGTKPHLCIAERNSPTPVRRRFSLTQEGIGRVIPGDEGPVDGINEGPGDGIVVPPHPVHKRVPR